MGSGEVGELIWRGDLGSSTGAVGFSRFKESAESYWYWYRAQVSYGFQQFCTKKKGDAKVSKVQVDDTSPKVEGVSQV